MVSVEVTLVGSLVFGQRRIVFLSKNAVVVGVLAGFAIFQSSVSSSFTSLNHSVVDVALAVVIYLAGVEVGWKTISTYFADVAFFGFGVTLLSGAMTTLILLPFTNATIYFVLIAAVAYVPTDPVLVFNQLGKVALPKRVITVIQGESILNDPLVLLLFSLGLSLLNGSESPIKGSAGGQLFSGVVNFFLQLAISLVIGAISYLMNRGDATLGILKYLSPILGVVFYVGAEHLSLSPYLPLFVLGLFTPTRPSSMVDLTSETSEIAVVVAVSAIIPLQIFLNLHAYLVGLLIFAVVDLIFRPLVAVIYFRLRGGSVADGALTGLLGLKGSLSLVVASEAYAIARTGSERTIAAGVAIALSLSLITKGGLAKRLVTLFAPASNDRRGSDSNE